MKRANEIIAETFGCSVQEVNEARYQEGRTSVPLYTFGDFYYCCPPARMLPGALPKGFAWQFHTDQFFAKREGRTVYRAHMEVET